MLLTEGNHLVPFVLKSYERPKIWKIHCRFLRFKHVMSSLVLNNKKANDFEANVFTSVLG